MIPILRVKFLYRSAVAELDSGHPFAAGMAVSLLQDAVEAMAHDAAASVGAQLGARASFLDYWEAIAKVGKVLPYRIEMIELNTARVAFKHHGVNPDQRDAEKHRAAGHRFLVNASSVFFGVDFDSLSEADLITDADIRAALKLAEQSLTHKDATTALEHCRDALNGVEALMRKAVIVSEDDQSGPPIPRAFREATAGIVKWVLRKFTALEKSVAMSVLQMNPAHYWFLYHSLPTKAFSGKHVWPPTQSVVSNRTPQRAQTCVRIVIDLALRTERVHFDLERLSTQAGIPEERKRFKEWSNGLVNQVTTQAAAPGPEDIPS